MEDSKIKALAKAGGICSRCGGLHTPEWDFVVLGIQADLPLCECPNCKVCERVREAIEALEVEDTEEEQGELWKTTR